MNINNRLGLIAGSLFFLGLTSCGGGGGDGSGPGATTNTPGTTSKTPGTTTTPPPTANTSRSLYLIAQPNGGEPHIEAYTIDAATGALTSNGAITGRDPSSNNFPGYLAVDPSSKFLYAIQDNIITAYGINGVTGTLNSTGTGSVPTPPSGVAMAFVPSGRFAYVAHAGNDDPTGTVLGYSVNAANGALSDIPGSPFASGQRSFSIAIHPSGQFAYVANALSGIWGYTIDSTTGALTNIGQISEQGTTFVAIAPSGKFAYVINAQKNDISVYSINPTTGLLTSIGPRVHTGDSTDSLTVITDSLTFAPSGKFAYVTHVVSDFQGSVAVPNDILAYSVDTTTGAMTSLGPATRPRSGRATFTIEASGKFAYVGNTEFADVSAYSIDAGTGALTEIPGSPFATGPVPHSLVVAGQ